MESCSLFIVVIGITPTTADTNTNTNTNNEHPAPWPDEAMEPPMSTEGDANCEISSAAPTFSLTHNQALSPPATLLPSIMAGIVIREVTPTTEPPPTPTLPHIPPQSPPHSFSPPTASGIQTLRTTPRTKPPPIPTPSQDTPPYQLTPPSQVPSHSQDIPPSQSPPPSQVTPSFPPHVRPPWIVAGSPAPRRTATTKSPPTATPHHETPL